MDPVNVAIACIALVVSVAGLILARLDYAKKAVREQIVDLSNRVKTLEEDLRQCQQECRRLREENVDLLRMLHRPQQS